MTERPAGVKAISALGVVVAVVSLAFASLLVAGRVPLSAGAFLIGGGLEQLGPPAFVIYAAVLLFLALGLWARSRWARRAAIFIAVAGIVFTVPAISSAVMDTRVFAIAREGLQIIVRALIVFYLSQGPVAEWFSRTPPAV